MSGRQFLEILKKSRFDFKKAKEYQRAYSEIAESGLFDSEYYLDAYSDVKDSEMDPLIHYIFHGYREGKLPSLYFNQEKYLAEHPDLTENPLIHYLGNKEEGFINKSNPLKLKRERILATNRTLLNDFQIEDEPLVSIIILTRNGLNHLKRLFEDFDRKTNYSNYEIIVVDNASQDDSISYLKSLDLDIKIIENKENQSFSKANNDAAKTANGEYLLFLNNDIEPTYGWLNELVGVMLENDGTKVVGAKLLFPEMPDPGQSFSIQHAGVKFREEITPYIYGPYHEAMFSTLIFNRKVNTRKEVVCCTAACLLVERDAFNKVNGFDENYFYGYEDVDLAFKFNEKGFRTIYNPQALLFHHESATRMENVEEKNQLNYRNIMYFYEKWKDRLFRDLLNDKLKSERFFTDKKLSFTVIADNKENDDFIKTLNQKYDVNVIADMENLDLGPDCDVIVSFNEEYPVSRTFSRGNLVKILVSDNMDNDEYDIVLNDESEVMAALEGMAEGDLDV